MHKQSRVMFTHQVFALLAAALFKQNSTLQVPFALLSNGGSLCISLLFQSTGSAKLTLSPLLLP